MMSFDYSWIPPTVAAVAVGGFLYRTSGTALKEIKDHLKLINGRTHDNTSDIATINERCEQREKMCDERHK